MAMNASTLKTALKATMKTKMSAKFGAPTDADALDKFCDAMADAISIEVVAHVQTASLNVPGLGIAAPNGPCSGASTTGTIS
jgi:hypothetical protein